MRGYDDSNVAERTSSLEPEPLSFRLLFRHPQPFLTPDPFHSLMVHSPSLDSVKVR